ncbi:MAG: hypothetical protein IJI34_04205 [Clostridia bacterium]|nr:hypothetical protein [Clostridia bacterium]
MDKSGFFVIGGFVMILWIVGLVIRLCAGSRSEQAVTDVDTDLQKPDALAQRVQKLNGVFRNTLRGGAAENEVRRLPAYLKEYAELAQEYSRRRKELREQFNKAGEALEGLRMSQNMLGGANDLGAILYCIREHDYNKAVRQFNSMSADDLFDPELYRQTCEYWKKRCALTA